MYNADQTSNTRITKPEDADLPASFEGATSEMYNAIKYGIYNHEGRLWTRQQNGDKAVSNFTITPVKPEPKQHSDIVVVKLTNTKGFSATIGMTMSYLKTARRFQDAIVAHGNFIFKGDTSDYARLLERLMAGE